MKLPIPGLNTTTGSADQRSRSLHVEFLLFAMIGVGNAVIDTGVFALLVGVFDLRHGIEPLLASVAGFVCGALHSYAWNSRVTFKMGNAADRPHVVGQFISVAIGGAIIGTIAFSAVRAVWPDDGTVLAASKLGAIAAGMTWNFLLMRGWVFSKRRLVVAPERELVGGPPDRA